MRYIDDETLARFRPLSIFALRVTLGVVFAWFGALKLFGESPVSELISLTFPFMAGGAGLVALGVVETAIGLLLIFNRYAKWALIALALHLGGTFLTFVIAPSAMFEPYPPFLSLWGEFVLKNAVLVAAAFAVATHEAKGA